MEFIDFTSIKDEMHRISIACELNTKQDLVRSMYQDICTTLGCYVPCLNITMFGLMKYVDGKNGNSGYLTRPGMYYAPSTILIALVDTFVAAYDHGMLLNIHDMDIMFKAELAHTIIHELSHSMQCTYVDPKLTSAMEWANEQNVWNVLYPALAPMLKKKYKIKLYEETVDETCGRVFSYKYNLATSYETVINFFVFHAMHYNNPKSAEAKKMIDQFPNVSVDLTMNGQKLPDNMRHIKIDGVLNYDTIDSLRTFLYNVPLSFDYDFAINTTLDGKNLEIVCDIRKDNYDVLYIPDSPDWE